MSFKADIGIIGALSDEVCYIISILEEKKTELVGGIEFNTGRLFGKNIVVAKCGVGKVFAAICAEAMLITYSPSLLVNTGVGGALSSALRPCDVVFADRLVQHDMDTSAIGDPKGLISGINKVFFDTDVRAREILVKVALEMGINFLVGTVATGDRFISEREDKLRISREFGAVACEMEGGAIAHAAFVSGTPVMVVRAISDSADGEASMDYPTFLPIATKVSTALTLGLIREY